MISQLDFQLPVGRVNKHVLHLICNGEVLFNRKVPVREACIWWKESSQRARSRRLSISYISWPASDAVSARTLCDDQNCLYSVCSHSWITCLSELVSRTSNSPLGSNTMLLLSSRSSESSHGTSICLTMSSTTSLQSLCSVFISKS